MGGEPIQLTLAHQATWIQLFLWSATHPLSGGNGGLFTAPHIQLEFVRSSPALSIPVGHRLCGDTCGHAEKMYSAGGRPPVNAPENISRSIIRGRARWLRSEALAAKADHLRMIPKTQMAERDNQLSKHSLTSICVPRQAQSYTDTHA